jgi:hypothetical protein
LPFAPPLPARPGQPTVLASDPPPGSGVDAGALRALAADAAARALALAQGATSSGLELTAAEDLARRGATLLAGGQVGPGLTELARRAAVPARELARQAIAFRDGGPEGLAVLSGSWDPDPLAVATGRGRLGPGAVARRNRVTLAERQLRLGRDGRWYPFRRDRAGRWQPEGAPLQPVQAESDLGDLAGDTDAG